MRTYRRKITIVLAMVAASAAIVSIARWDQVRGPAPVGPACELLADDAGAITHVVCVVNSARRATLRNADLVTRIVNALPERVHVTILTNDRPAFIVARDPHPGRVDLADLPAESSFTI